MGGKADDFDTVLKSIPTHEDFCSGKIKTLAYMIFQNGGHHYLWSDREGDAEIQESDLAEMDKGHGVKVEKLAIFKLYKTFDRSEASNDTSNEGKANGEGRTDRTEKDNTRRVVS